MTKSIKSLLGVLPLENLAIRQQLARCHTRPQVRPGERTFWVVLSKAWSGWRSTLLIVEPEAGRGTPHLHMPHWAASEQPTSGSVCRGATR
jgi:hypothetical protein